MNDVEQLKVKIQHTSQHLELGVKFSTSTYADRGQVSRVLVYKGDPPVNYRSESVVRMWEFKGPPNLGKTVKSRRYAIYSEVLEYLNGLECDSLEQLYTSLTKYAGKDLTTFNLIRSTNRGLLETMDAKTRDAYFEAVHAATGTNGQNSA